MDIRSEIKKLARMEEASSPVISLYLNIKWEDEQQRERIRLFIKNELRKGWDQLKDQEEWRRHFIEDQQRIEKYGEGLVRRAYWEGVNGMAIFSCSGANMFATYPSIIPFENQFFLSETPVLRPLVRLSSQYQNTLAVMVETDSAKLLELSLEGLLGEFSIESYVPGRHDQGGWAQGRYQRHIKDHMDKHHKEVAEQLTELFDSTQWKHIVLIGQERILANFKSFLPERVKMNIADTFSLDFSEDRSKVLRKIFEHLLQKERLKIHDEIQKLKERSPQGGMATLGLTQTLEALNQGQVHTLYLSTSFSYKGRKCKRCGSLFAPPLENPSLPCPLCKGELKRVDLGEEMMKASLRQDGEVKWVEENEALREHEGVGASLRFR